MALLNTDGSTHAHKLCSQHETVLKHVLGDEAGTIGHAFKHHELSLHIGGETRIRKRLDIHGNEPLTTTDSHAVLKALDLNAHLGHFCKRDIEMHRVETGNGHTLVGAKSTGNDEGTSLNAVANRHMVGRVELLHAFNAHNMRTGINNLCAHVIEHVCQIDNLRLTGSVLNDGRALCLDGTHHDVLCGTYAGKIERDNGTMQASRAVGTDIAMVVVDLHAKCCQTRQMLVDRAGTDVAPAGHGHNGLAETRDKRAKNRDACTHLRNVLIGSDPVAHRLGVDDELMLPMNNAGAERLEHLAHEPDIRDVRHIAEVIDARRHDSCSHELQG